MVRYTHDNLTLRQKLKARWRSYKLVAAKGAEMVDREGLSIRAATRLAAAQHNAEVTRRREQEAADEKWISYLARRWNFKRGEEVLRDLREPGKVIVAIAGTFSFGLVPIGSRIGMDQAIFPGAPPMTVAVREQCAPDTVLVIGQIPGEGEPLVWEPDVVTKYQEQA